LIDSSAQLRRFSPDLTKALADEYTVDYQSNANHQRDQAGNPHPAQNLHVARGNVATADDALHQNEKENRDRNTYTGCNHTAFNFIEALDLKEVTLVGHSTGGGEVTRYIGRHGTKRVAAAVLIGAVPPILVKSASNPEGIPIEVFDGLRSSLAKDRSQFWKDFAIMFFGANRPGAKVSQGLLDEFWLWSMQGGLKNLYDSIKAFSETDFHEDLKKFDVPTLVMHGEDDQIVPIDISGKRSAKLIKGAKEIFYPGLPHGLTATNGDQVNADLLKFLKSVQQVRKAA